MFSVEWTDVEGIRRGVGSYDMHGRVVRLGTLVMSDGAEVDWMRLACFRIVFCASDFEPLTTMYTCNYDDQPQRVHSIAQSKSWMQCD